MFIKENNVSPKHFKNIIKIISFLIHLGYVGDTGWPADLAGGLCINLTDEAFLVAPAIFIVPLAVVAVHLHRILVTVVVGFAALPVGVMNGTVVRNPGPDIFVDDIIKSGCEQQVFFSVKERN